MTLKCKKFVPPTNTNTNTNTPTEFVRPTTSTSSKINPQLSKKHINLLSGEEPFTPYEIVSSRKPSERIVKTENPVEQVEKAIASLIKSRTQLLQQAILDGFLGVSDSDKFRVTKMIKKLIDHKPDVAVRLLAKMLPTLSDADLQKHMPKSAAQINIFNQNATSPFNPSNTDITITDTDFSQERQLSPELLSADYTVEEPETDL